MDAVSTTRRGRPPKMATPEVLGTFDIGEGLPENALDVVATGIPSALNEVPSWQRMSKLDMATPKARLGYVQRWVRVKTLDGKADVANKAEAIQDGWRPRRVESMADVDATYPIYDAGDGKGGIYVFKEELVLFERPIELEKRANDRLKAAEGETNRVIYSQTNNQNGLPSKYASLNFDEGRDAASLID